MMKRMFRGITVFRGASIYDVIFVFVFVFVFLILLRVISLI